MSGTKLVIYSLDWHFDIHHLTGLIPWTPPIKHLATTANQDPHRQPDVIDESVVGASLLYEAVAQAFLDVGEELVKKGAKSAYNHKRVAFKGGGEMSCYELCMTTLIGCPCV